MSAIEDLNPRLATGRIQYPNPHTQQQEKTLELKPKACPEP